MLDDISDIQEFYDSNVDKEDDRLDRHPIERDITWRYLEIYLPATGSILDIGAGAGAYTIPLAKRGYSVTAIDLSSALINTCKKKVSEANLENKVTCLTGDARDLSTITKSDFDAVLLLGPLYHLIQEEDRTKAIKEAFTKLKKGGIIFSAFISRFGIWGDVMRKMPDYIEKQKDLDSVLQNGRDAEIPEWRGKFRAYFANPLEIAPLHEHEGFRTMALAGVEPAGIAVDEQYLSLTDKHRKMWLDLLFKISKEETIIGASCHLLYVGRKYNR
jgi:S-adenosylmethionine-dependent methyltransferase